MNASEGSDGESDRKSVSEWIDRLKTGDEEAAAKLWERYFQRLVAVASKKLGNAPRRTFDEEDIVVSTFKSICRGAAEGRFPKFEDRNDLWKLLVTIAHQKSVDRIRRQTAKKRGGGDVMGESAFGNPLISPFGIEQFAGEEPTPETLAIIAEQHEKLLSALPGELGQIARLRMDGYSTPEIAEQTGLSDRSIRRKLNMIAEIWSAELSEQCQ